MVQGHRVTVGIFLLVGLFAHGLSEQLSESERRSAFIGYSEGAIPEPVVRSVPKRHNSRREGPLEGTLTNLFMLGLTIKLGIWEIESATITVYVMCVSSGNSSCLLFFFEYICCTELVVLCSYY